VTCLARGYHMLTHIFTATVPGWSPVGRGVAGAWDQGALALLGGVLAASWFFSRCFSANVSAAILFKKVARTSPLPSPSLTAKNAPSWVTTYVAISLIWHSSLQNYSGEPVGSTIGFF
jgi:hypothetical protein